MLNRKSKLGSTNAFTIIELIMVMLVIAFLSAIAVPQFINFRKEAKDAKLQYLLGAIRSGIANQTAQIALRCNTTSGTVPTVAHLTANDVTGSFCATTEIISAAERKIITDDAFPANPWSTAGTTATITACTTAASCTRCHADACDASGTPTGGWCYNTTTGEFWADSEANGGTAGTNLDCDF